MKVLLVDHVWRKHSHSTDFFKEILIEAGCEVVEFWLEKVYCSKIPREVVESVDVIVLFEFLYGRFDLGVFGAHCVFVPMYDNESGSVWQWKRIALSRMPVVSFCDKISQLARRCGVKSVVDVRFAFNPNSFEDFAGNPRVVALWDRGQVGFDVVKSIFAPTDVDKVIVVQKMEEPFHRSISDQDKQSYHVEIRKGQFLPKDEYIKSLREPGIFIAPRYKEGIGMPFLEQLAMGKCVIAHDEPTMNEYINDGVTGILMDMSKPRRIGAAEVERVRKSVRGAMKLAFERWMEDRRRLVKFFSSRECIPVCTSMRTVKSCLFFVLALVEFIVKRFVKIRD